MAEYSSSNTVELLSEGFSRYNVCTYATIPKCACYLAINCLNVMACDDLEQNLYKNERFLSAKYQRERSGRGLGVLDLGLYGRGFDPHTGHGSLFVYPK